ncbi:hypothetical protein PbJCM13498_33420 [Prolixibacter bellariivorans]|uniref:Uncharacterized protein n=2 Tax=Prolixibacter bellariivorans TaxID=314319 RepID=A0A5M4B2U1_9BACT|nr:hypothetical protein [Prolixibacter bellariivorans]GET34479.1 hypothetical protein PbJCM13498_33420 [Prolixibacter bellariivorans]
MTIGPDGRIIRRNVRRVTPVNTYHPEENLGFIMSYLVLVFLSIAFVVAFVILGWLGDLILNWTWWTASNFGTVGTLINFLIFPIYISGVIEGLYYGNRFRYKLYAFIYGFITIAIPQTLDQLNDAEFNWMQYGWALGYGLYCLWLALKMAD